MDEASAAVVVSRDSQPEEVDRLERAKLQLEIELEALKTELKRNKKDDVAKAKIEEAQKAISRIDEELAPIKARYDAEKAKSGERHLPHNRGPAGTDCKIGHRGDSGHSQEDRLTPEQG